MPLFGKPKGDFMWPAVEYIDTWKFDSKTCLKTIGFKQDEAMKGVQVSLTNGCKSPLF